MGLRTPSAVAGSRGPEEPDSVPGLGFGNRNRSSSSQDWKEPACSPGLQAPWPVLAWKALGGCAKLLSSPTTTPTSRKCFRRTGPCPPSQVRPPALVSALGSCKGCRGLEQEPSLWVSPSPGGRPPGEPFLSAPARIPDPPALATLSVHPPGCHHPSSKADAVIGEGKHSTSVGTMRCR